MRRQQAYCSVHCGTLRCVDGWSLRLVLEDDARYLPRAEFSACGLLGCQSLWILLWAPPRTDDTVVRLGQHSLFPWLCMWMVAKGNQAKPFVSAVGPSCFVFGFSRDERAFLSLGCHEKTGKENVCRVFAEISCRVRVYAKESLNFGRTYVTTSLLIITIRTIFFGVFCVSWWCVLIEEIQEEEEGPSIST